MYAIIDYRASEASLSTLRNYGFTPILMLPADYLTDGVASHSDMLLFIGFGKIFCHTMYYNSHKELIDLLLSVSGIELILSDEKTGEKYPLDVLFNACLLNNRLICNEKTVSKLILNEAKERGIEIINVPQGYTKCSVCPVSENAIITSDKPIADACRTHGIDVLLICEGNISLPPYNYGFIGGTAGYCDGKVYFCGSLATHPNGEKIKKFCTEHGADAVELSNEVLQDVGTIFFT